MKTSIIEKVKKLLAKAGSTDSPQEAEALFVAAQKLMVKHRIQQSELNDDQVFEVLANEVAAFQFKLEGMWELELASVIARANCCKVTWKTWSASSKSAKNYKYVGGNRLDFCKITFYGVEQDVQLVKFLYETTRDTFRRLSKSEARAANKVSALANKNRFIRSFLLGAAEGLGTHIRKMTADHVQESGATTYDLVVRTQLQKVEQWLTDNVKTKTVKVNSEPGDLAGYASGMEAGMNHSMHIPVETTSSNNNKQLN